MISETDIIFKYLNKLNFKKKETFHFKNDGAFLKHKNNMEIVVTNDSITETVDFFKNDAPESIAHKIMTYNTILMAFGQNRGLFRHFLAHFWHDFIKKRY